MNIAIEHLYSLQEIEMGPKAGAPESKPLIEKLRKDIPAPILGHYDRLRARGKSGVAIVRGGVCTGCHMRLAVGVNVELLRGEDVMLCDSCGRYVIAPPNETDAPQPPPAPPGMKKITAPKKRRKSTPTDLPTA